MYTMNRDHLMALLTYPAPPHVYASQRIQNNNGIGSTIRSTYLGVLSGVQREDGSGTKFNVTTDRGTFFIEAKP